MSTGDVGQPVLFMGSFQSQCTRAGCGLCVPLLPIRGGCRLQMLQYPFLDGSLVEMQPHIEDGQTLRGLACPHLRALFIHLKDSSKYANELLHKPHTVSFSRALSKGCVCGCCQSRSPLSHLLLLVTSTEGMLSGLTGDDRSREVPKLVLWGKKSIVLSRKRSVSH